MLSLIIGAVVYILFAAGFLYAVFGGFIGGAMYMRLPDKHVQRMLKYAKLERGKLVFDLGAGCGNISFAAAESGASVVAVEFDWLKSWWIQRKISQKHLLNVLCVKSNLLNVDLSKADVLLCYLGNSLMDKIAEKQLKKGCVIVSCCHKIRKWKPTVVDAHKVYPIYVYEVA
jgi:predicted RNA methylase